MFPSLGHFSIVRCLLLLTALTVTLLPSCSQLSSERYNLNTLMDNDVSRENHTLSSGGGIGSYRLSVSNQREEEAWKVLEEKGEEWFFGTGFGKTILNVGLVAIFPPYAIYLLGNAGLEIAGYQPIFVTDILPENGRREVSKEFEEFVSVPGRINAAVFNHAYLESNELAGPRLFEDADLSLENELEQAAQISDTENLR